MDDHAPRFTLFWLPRERMAGTARGPTLGTALGAALVTIPGIGLFLTGLLPQQDVYADYGFSLLAALGAAECIGYLAGHIPRRFGLSFRSYPVLAWVTPTAVTSTDGPCEGENWPLLVALLFGPISILLAGLGGWV